MFINQGNHICCCCLASTLRSELSSLLLSIPSRARCVCGFVCFCFVFVFLCFSFLFFFVFLWFLWLACSFLSLSFLFSFVLCACPFVVCWWFLPLVVAGRGASSRVCLRVLARSFCYRPSAGLTAADSRDQHIRFDSIMFINCLQTVYIFGAIFFVCNYVFILYGASSCPVILVCWRQLTLHADCIMPRRAVNRLAKIGVACIDFPVASSRTLGQVSGVDLSRTLYMYIYIYLYYVYQLVANCVHIWCYLFCL